MCIYSGHTGPTPGITIWHEVCYNSSLVFVKGIMKITMFYPFCCHSCNRKVMYCSNRIMLNHVCAVHYVLQDVWQLLWLAQSQDLSILEICMGHDETTPDSFIPPTTLLYCIKKCKMYGIIYCRMVFTICMIICMQQ